MSGIFDQITNYSPSLISSGQVVYKGTWNAATNTPTLLTPPAATSKGNYYVVSAIGTQFGISFAVGDWIISNGTAWEKVDLTDAVSSVFGRTGAVVGVSTDYSAVGLTNTAIGASNPSTGAFTTVTASSTISATGAVTGSNLSGTNTGDQTTITGNAGTATALQTARTIGGSSFNGTANVTSFPVPGAIGVTTPAAANFTSIGVTTQGTGAFTTLSASGNLTVDTDTLFVDSTNNRVGIGLTNPQQQLAVGNASDQVGAGVSGTVSTLYFGVPSNLTGGISRLSYDRSTGTLTFTGGTTAAPVTAMTVHSLNGVAVMGALTSSTGFGCNGNAAQTKAVSGGTLAGVIAALVANGILSS